ncbi:MAG: RIO1 family regulatory kinase/ATPase [Myxococcota bacterium]|nr:RIO1 family regulatory kinase/ATPase [Myxococcota bacterium]
MTGTLVREELASAEPTLLKRGRGAKPDVLLVKRSGGDTVVVKDYSQRSGWVRRWLAPHAVAREQRVHEALRDHISVPRVLGRVDPLALVLEYREGEPLSRSLASRLGEERAAQFALKLEDAVAQMHRCGVVHLDLRHRDNILCDEQAQPVLLDFVAAMCFRPGSFWYRWYRPTVLIYDEYALSKWRDRLQPGAQPRPHSLWRRLRSALKRFRQTPPRES